MATLGEYSTISQNTTLSTNPNVSAYQANNKTLSDPFAAGNINRSLRNFSQKPVKSGNKEAEKTVVTSKPNKYLATFMFKQSCNV